MRAPKAMKSMEAMKAMKSRARTDGQIWRELVWDDEITYTKNRLEKNDLVKINGKIMSKKVYENGKANPWCAACVAARKALGIKGFAAIKKGSPLYNKAKALYKNPCDAR